MAHHFNDVTLQAENYTTPRDVTPEHEKGKGTCSKQVPFPFLQLFCKQYCQQPLGRADRI